MKNFFKIFFFSAVLVISVNFFLKFILTYNAGETVKKDSQLGWDFSNFKKKNFNDLGFRTPLSSEEIKKNKLEKIVFMGNSVVAGDTLNYDKVFPYLFNQYTAGKYLALNAGSEGYEIYREYLKYQKDYSLVNPKFLIWFPSTNDYQNKAAIFQNFVQTAEAQGTQDEKFPLNLISGFNVLAARIQNFKQLTNEQFLWADKNKQYTNPLLEKIPSDNVETLVLELNEMNQYLKQKGTQLIVVFVPPHYFCKYHRWEDAVSFKELDGILKGMGVATISLFDKLSCRDKTIYEDYVHFNEQGHEEIAKILSTELKPYLKL